MANKVRFVDNVGVNAFGNVSPEAIITASGGVGSIIFTKENGNQIVLPLATTQSSADSLTTASVAGNVITFTKGDLSTFSVTVATGSGGGGSVDTGSLLTTGSVSNNVLTFTKGDGTSFTLVVNTGSGEPLPAGTVSSSTQITELGFVTSSATASFITNSQTSSMSVLSAQTASYVLNAVSSSHALFAISASYAVSSSHEIIKEISSSHADFADTASKSLDNVLTASATNNVITFTKGDTSTFTVTIDTGSGEPLPSGTVSSSAQISELGFVTSSATASFVTNSQTGSFITNSQTSSMSVATASFAITASHALNTTDAKFLRFVTGSGNDSIQATGTNVNASGNCAAVLTSKAGTASGNYSLAAAGKSNTVSGNCSVVLGGESNTVSGDYSTITAGCEHKICNSARNAGILGGTENEITTVDAGIVGGYQNCLRGGGGAIVGGNENCTSTSGAYSAIAGGCKNTITANFGGVLGGCKNQVTAACTVVLGGNNITGSVANHAYVPNLSTLGNITGSAISASGNILASSFSAPAGVINQLTASYAISASVEIIKEISSSHANFADTASKSLDNVLTASVNLNTITFTKGDNSTFTLTVDTGSGGGGSVPAGTVSSSAQISELGFVTSSATASFIVNSQTSSMTVGTASIADFIPFNGNRAISNQDQPLGIRNVNFNANGLADFIEKVYFTNTAPVITTSNFTIGEFVASGSTVGTVVATDAESGSQTILFSTSSTYTADQFRIDSGSGVITLNVKSTSSMNTFGSGSPAVDVAPFPVIATDTFGLTGSKTIFIRVTPNTAPIWSTVEDGSLTTSATASLSESSALGNDKDRFYFRDDESDTITVGSGSFSTHFTTAFRLVKVSNYIRLDQITSSLDFDLYPTYSFVLTASDEHYESGDDPNSIAYLPVRINVLDDLPPTINPQTLGGINENSTTGAVAGTVSATNNDGGTITFSGFVLKSANKDGGANITSSLGGTSLLDPSSDPFTINSGTGQVTRKAGQFFNSDVANRYIYTVTVTDNLNPSSNSADITIPIANDAASTVTDNWTNLYIIESARTGEFIKNAADGFGGSTAQWSSAASQRWDLTSNPDFIEVTNLTASATQLRLSTNLSGSATTGGDTINLALTASENAFFTTKQLIDQNVSVVAMTPPQWSTSDQSSNLNTNGARPSNNLVLASVSDVQSYGIDHSTFTFTPNAGQALEAVQNGGADSYYIRPTANLAAGTYGYTASIFNDRGFTAGELKDEFTIAQAGSGTLTTNGTFYIIESATGSANIVINPNGRTGDQGDLGVNYGGTGYNGAAVQGFTSSNAAIAVTDTGLLSMAVNVSGSPSSSGDTFTSNITWNDQYGNAGGPTAITINVAANSVPTASFVNASPLQAPLGADTKLVDVTITDLESDTPFSMSLGGASAASLKAVPTNAVSSSYEIRTAGTVSSGVTFTYNATISDNFGKTRTYTGNTVEVTEAFPTMYIYTIDQSEYGSGQTYNNVLGIASEDSSTPPVATIQATFGVLEAVKNDDVLGDATFTWQYGGGKTATRRGNPQAATVDLAISGSSFGPGSGTPVLRALLFVPSGSNVSQVPTSFTTSDPNAGNTTEGQYVMFISHENEFQNSSGGLSNDIKQANVNKITIDTAVDGYTDWLVYGTDADFASSDGNLYWRFIPANAASGSVPS